MVFERLHNIFIAHPCVSILLLILCLFSNQRHPTPQHSQLDKGIWTICQARDGDGSHDRVTQVSP